jgi:hypothetical protein
MRQYYTIWKSDSSFSFLADRLRKRKDHRLFGSHIVDFTFKLIQLCKGKMTQLDINAVPLPSFFRERSSGVNLSYGLRLIV